eukprot:5641000-Heterocapsa_arctica.AAC.1
MAGPPFSKLTCCHARIQCQALVWATRNWTKNASLLITGWWRATLSRTASWNPCPGHSLSSCKS